MQDCANDNYDVGPGAVEHHGATAVMRHAKDKSTPMASWAMGLLKKKPFRLVSVALANKLARIAWVLLTRGETYRPYATIA